MEFKYKKIEARLKTNKPLDYLWEKINTPKKVLKIEGFDKYHCKKISENNYEIITPKRLFFLTFIPHTGVNLFFINKNDDCSLAWFEIKGEHDCTIIHGNSVRIDNDSKWFKENNKIMKQHFLEELRGIAR
ncbi:hypothetical protein K9L16_02475 [Candidatus Pacearchaeota archaeon]|nr:hypothetical protein [Candidatus Pacearchaeota archaeon]